MIKAPWAIAAGCKFGWVVASQKIRIIRQLPEPFAGKCGTAAPLVGTFAPHPLFSSDHLGIPVFGQG